MDILGSQKPFKILWRQVYIFNPEYYKHHQTGYTPMANRRRVGNFEGTWNRQRFYIYRIIDTYSIKIIFL